MFNGHSKSFNILKLTKSFNIHKTTNLYYTKLMLTVNLAWFLIGTIRHT